MKIVLSLVLICALTGFADPNAVAAEKKPVSAEKGKLDRSKSLPFHGSLDAVDKAAKTIKVGEQTFQVTSETRITKAGKPATLDDAKVGEELAGSYKQADGGRLELRLLRLGPKTTETKPPKKEKEPAS